ncbi:hypothetical protein NDU88_002086 [Pleurodeles waltl]|uniref:Uncharacterized protein n=1 Tax=Pleurodeles waltl TaxID=8319 RepID=A0AAV7MMU3_PLEWA|nr:hypothetical protein NDU88_002086 [Pleurodeles waltl]
MARTWLDITFPDFNKPSGEAWEHPRPQRRRHRLWPRQARALERAGGRLPSSQQALMGRLEVLRSASQLRNGVSQDSAETS